MSLSTTIAQVAASNPVVGAAVQDENMKSALLYSLQSGDSATSNLLGALYSKETEQETLFNSTSDPNLGQNIDVKA
jgi:hypothetical protein